MKVLLPVLRSMNTTLVLYTYDYAQHVLYYCRTNTQHENMRKLQEKKGKKKGKKKYHVHIQEKCEEYSSYY